MKLAFRLVLAAIILFGSVAGALGSNVKTDHDHSVNFSQYHTYSWGQVKTSDPSTSNALRMPSISSSRPKDGS